MTLFLNVLTTSVWGQSKLLKNRNDFLNADSVIIVSHLTTYEPISNNVRKERQMRTLVINGKPNYEIIKQRCLLNKTERDSIYKILTEPNNDNLIEKAKCFIPHHGILLFKNGKWSFFDICFDCRHFVTSKRFSISDELSKSSWMTLELFFRNRDLTYELPTVENDHNGQE